MRIVKSKLQAVWGNKAYAARNDEQILTDFWHNQAYVQLYNLIEPGMAVLDAGCGDGRILDIVWRPGVNFVGVELVKQRVLEAKRRLGMRKDVTPLQGDVEELAAGGRRFDLVYCTYVLEHVDWPEEVIEQLIKVVKKNGRLVIICPNYGSPVEYSPGSPKEGETLRSRAVGIFIKSLGYLFRPPHDLDWRRVDPPVLTDSVKWFRDADVTQEPYIQTLLYFLRKHNVQIIESSSGIEKISGGWSVLGWTRRLFLGLGKLGIVPFKYYGPRLFVIGRIG